MDAIGYRGYIARGGGRGGQANCRVSTTIQKSEGRYVGGNGDHRARNKKMRNACKTS